MKEVFIKVVLWFYVFAYNIRKNDCLCKLLCVKKRCLVFALFASGRVVAWGCGCGVGVVILRGKFVCDGI